MLWLFYTIGCSFFNALHGVVIKKLTKRLSYLWVVWLMYIFALPFVVAALSMFGVPGIKPAFWKALIAGVLINALAITLYVKALEVSPLSLTIPFLSFTPLFLILTSNLMLHELPSSLGVIGIILIVSGSYFINIEHIKKGILAPFKNIYKERGSLLVLIVAFLWSITANIDKIAVISSSPAFYVLMFHLAFSIVYLPVVLKSGIKIKKIKAHIPMLILLGLLGAMLIILQMLAIRIALVSYVIAIKRAGLVFSIIFGLLFFKEKNILLRLAGASLMVAGIFFIAIG